MACRRHAQVHNATEMRATGGLIERMDVALHGLCQPLTVLQCRLAMGDLIGKPDAMRDAIREALSECSRLNAVIGTMRAMLQHEIEMEESEMMQ